MWRQGQQESRQGEAYHLSLGSVAEITRAIYIRGMSQKGSFSAGLSWGMIRGHHREKERERSEREREGEREREREREREIET